ncbi:laccase-7-like [Camellia sinensis]|uniref:laccase-7-like n=1 Tax=Camellia sinensis TaxID=4442 RepID=UPI0010369522|nr:laccase-7-like [Camellia sinensis]
MAMARPLLLLACAFAFLASSLSFAAIVEHTFHVQNLTVQLLCHQRVIIAVNGNLPGPRIQVHEGDTLVGHVFNKSPYNLTIHW